MFKNKNLRRKILIVFAILGLFKVGMHIPVPHINRSALEGVAENGSYIPGIRAGRSTSDYFGRLIGRLSVVVDLSSRLKIENIKRSYHKFRNNQSIWGKTNKNTA